ncbi:MAG: hypothetical protein ACJ77N_09635 [Chloroflexota bacterium]
MAELSSPEKAFYSVAEVAELTRRPPGMVRRWIFRRQIAAIWLEDGTVYVPLFAVRERLARPPRVERALRGRRTAPLLTACSEDPVDH